MTSDNTMYMPVAPAYGNNDMMGGGWSWWIIILLIFGGWGNGFGFGGNGNVNADIQRGFDQAAVTNGITNLQTAICNGFAGVSNGFAQAEIGANARQMADMNQNFALQTGIGDLKYAVATEACADRNAISMALQQVLNASNANTQRLLDTMCQDKIDAKNETIALLRQQLNMAQLANSQNEQTATILSTLAPVAKPAYVVQNPNGCGCNTGCGCGNV